MQKDIILTAALISLALFACIHERIKYNKICYGWEIENEEYLDSAQFFGRDSLFFFDDMYHVHDNHVRSTLPSFYKSDHTFSAEIKNMSCHGFYSINRSKKELILYTCDTRNDDSNSWIKKKSDTFTIVKLNKYELVLARKK